ncbi:AraC family transcriptional regulator [Geodermatophilus sp. CPCC 206100]|uniref:AraC family transcriptional regulator n=1 Tax=Geodermatophilus sp. CPCC 206100 TaxID=3020054 RepID=UPI003B005BE1
MRPSARCAALHGYVGLAESVGLDAGRMLARVGLEAADLADPDRWVPAVAVARLLEWSAAESGREDFGPQLAQLRRLSTVGALSVVLREEPDLRSVLQLLIRYEHSYNEAIQVTLTEADGLATMAGWLQLGEPAPTRQLQELAVAALIGLVRRFREPQWQPRMVCFTHPPPRDPTPYRLLLGPALRFGHEFTGVVFSARDLDSANALADADDPMILTYTRQFLRLLPPPHTRDVVDRVRELVQALLPLRRCTMPQVARALGVTTRTLHRLLAARQESFAAIVGDARAGLAERYLASDRYTISDVSDRLGFAASSAFSRWFRRRFGVSPTAWREATVGPAVPT